MLMEKKPFNRVKKTLEETSGRATEGSLFQDGQTRNRCCVYRKQQQFTVYKLHQEKNIKTYNHTSIHTNHHGLQDSYNNTIATACMHAFRLNAIKDVHIFDCLKASL